MPLDRTSFIRSLFDTYLARYAARDERLAGMFSENFSGYTGCGDFLVHDRERWLAITHADFDEVPYLDIDIVDVAVQDLAADVVAATGLFHIHLPGDDPLVAREVLRLSLVFRRESDGWRAVHSGISVPYHLRDDGRIFPLDSIAARAVELERLVEERTAALERANVALETLTVTDDLTGIANRRAFDRRIAEEWRRARRAGRCLTLLMIDIDNFKHYNDFYGHVVGDRCLERIARVLAGSVRRASDLAARYGGEEFAVLLPDADVDEAIDVATLIRRKLTARALVHEGVGPGIVTVSIGVACREPEPGGDPRELVRAADEALYRAKRAGRDRIEAENGATVT